MNQRRLLLLILPPPPPPPHSPPPTHTRTHPADSIDLLGLSKVDLNTGDRLRASIKMKAQQVGELHGIQSLWYKPREVASVPEIEEITPPPFVSLTVGGPVHPPLAGAGGGVSQTRVISFVPTRMHSGLELSLCMMAGDSRGLCRPIGDGTERCIQVRVHRCKYAMRKGEDLVYVSGLFEVNWIQMWALNPTYLTPEVAAPDGNVTINIGQLYQVRKGEHIHDLARRFGMTLKQVMFFNADLSHQKAAAVRPHPHALASSVSARVMLLDLFQLSACGICDLTVRGARGTGAVDRGACGRQATVHRAE